MPERPKIRPETLETLLNHVSDPRRLGGSTRALRIVSRACGREFHAFGELQDFFSSMPEEEAASLLAELGYRMPDLTKNTVFETLRRLRKAA